MNDCPSEQCKIISDNMLTIDMKHKAESDIFDIFSPN